MIRWISSYPKSGNTWVRLFLTAYEKPDSFDLNRRPVHFKQDIDPNIYKRLSPVPLDELTMVEARLLRGAVLVWLSRLADVKTKGPVNLKTHCANVTINGTSWIPPELTESALYLLRDPRDVAVSFADHLGVSIDDAIARMADNQRELHAGTAIHQPLMSWSTHVRSWRRDLPYSTFALRYEDLLADPDKWFREVLKFFGYLFDQERFDWAMRLTGFDVLRASEDAHGYKPKSAKQTRFFRRGKAGGWRGVLTDEQAARIETDHGAVMRECGYE